MAGFGFFALTAVGATSFGLGLSSTRDSEDADCEGIACDPDPPSDMDARCDGMSDMR